MSANKASDKGSCLRVSVSNPEDSWSDWTGSDGSDPELDTKELESIRQVFFSRDDPYNPMCFTACAIGAVSQRATASQVRVSGPASTTQPDTRDVVDGVPSTFTDAKKEQRRMAPCREVSPSGSTVATFKPDPGVRILSSSQCPVSEDRKFERRTEIAPRAGTEFSPRVKDKCCLHPDKTLVPWKKAGLRPGATVKEEMLNSETCKDQTKKVRCLLYVRARLDVCQKVVLIGFL